MGKKNYTLLITIRYIPGEKYNFFFFILSLTRLRYIHSLYFHHHHHHQQYWGMYKMLYGWMDISDDEIYKKKLFFLFFSLKRDLSTLSLYNMLYYYSLTRFCLYVSTAYRFSFRFHFDMMMLLFLGVKQELCHQYFFLYFIFNGIVYL